MGLVWVFGTLSQASAAVSSFGCCRSDLGTRLISQALCSRLHQQLAASFTNFKAGTLQSCVVYGSCDGACEHLVNLLLCGMTACQTLKLTCRYGVRRWCSTQRHSHLSTWLQWRKHSTLMSGMQSHSIAAPQVFIMHRAWCQCRWVRL